MNNTLLLASTSKSRQILLKEAGIPYKLVSQSADESACDWGQNLQEAVESIAKHKMDHVILHSGKEGEVCYVLTADTMGVNRKGEICGKPKDKNDAIRMIKSYRSGSQTYTAFCLDKKIFKNNSWLVEERIIEIVGAEYIFYIPDNWIERYFELVELEGLSFSQFSGAVAIEAFGAQFVKTINGSYTAVMGLPMFELREALEEIGFFKN